MKLKHPLVASVAVIAALCLSGAVTFAAAGPSDNPALDLTSGGSAVTAATDGTSFLSTADAPNSLVDTATTQSITKTWAAGHFGLADSNVIAPEGWTVEYTTDGTNWSSTVPANLDTVSGVRTRKTYNSRGTATRQQLSISTAPSVIKQQSLGSLTVTGLGDGYDVFFNEDHTKIFNVFHHGAGNSSYNKIDCHEMTVASGGARCSGYPVSMPNGLGTNDRSTGAVVGSRVWVPVGNGSSPGGGFACFNVSGGACSTPFVQLTTNVNSNVYKYSNVANIAQIDSYLFTQNFKDGRLLCLDGDTGAACAHMPAGGFDIGNGPMSPWPSNLLAVGPRIYSNDGNNTLGCLDTMTWTTCAGWSTPLTTTKDHHVFALPNDVGAIIGICTFDKTSAECFQEDKTPLAVPASLAAARLAIPHATRTNLDQYYGYTSGPRTVGSRVYWLNMIFDANDAITNGPGKIACWDAALDSGDGDACNYTALSKSYITDNAYALVIDPDNPDCLWTNDNNGNLQSFDAITGNPSCPGSLDAAVKIPYNIATPRFSCYEEGRIRAWDKITIDATLTDGRTLGDLKVTIKRGGLPIAGWTNRAVSGAGLLDLSTLNVATSGTKPTFEIKAAGLTDAEAGTIIGYVSYTSDAPQLCITLKPLTYCPTGVGQASGSTLARANDTVSLAVKYQDTSNTYDLTDSKSVTRTAVSNCLGVVRGTITQSSYGTVTPLANRTVTLKDKDGNVVGTATTDSNGNYSFANMYAHAYSVWVGDQQVASTVSENTTTVKDFQVTVTTTTTVPVEEVDGLPKTGSDSGLSVGLGIVMVVGGLMLVAVASRRRVN